MKYIHVLYDLSSGKIYLGSASIRELFEHFDPYEEPETGVATIVNPSKNFLGKNIFDYTLFTEEKP